MYITYLHLGISEALLQLSIFTGKLNSLLAFAGALPFQCQELSKIIDELDWKKTLRLCSHHVVLFCCVHKTL